MWTREPSFATSRRPEPNERAALATAWPLAIALTCLSPCACIVTDEIDFQAAVNHPVQIAATAPSAESLQAVAIGSKYTLTVQVRDPDSYDDPSPLLEAQIALSLQPYAPDFENPANRNPACEPAVLLDSAAGDKDHGSLYQIDCPLDLGEQAVEQMLHVGDILLARVLVSDLGFVSGDIPELATTAVAHWSLRVTEDAP